jgi:hypothetical protein
MMRENGDQELWLRWEAEVNKHNRNQHATLTCLFFFLQKDDGGLWRLDSARVEPSQILSDVTVASVIWTLVKEIAFSSSNRSVVVTLPRLVALISDSPRGSALRTLRSQTPSTVALQLNVGPNPWLRYITSAGIICVLSVLLYRFVFIRMEALGQDVKARHEQMMIKRAESAPSSSSSSSSSSNVQVFSAATNMKQVKRYGGLGAPRGAKKKEGSLVF